MVDAVTLGALKRLSYPQFSSRNALTALSGGGQTGALLLPAAVNVVATVANPGDSVMLPKEGGGKRIIVINAGASSLNVFPNNTTDTINALGVQTAYAVPVGDVIEFIGTGSGQWYASVPSIDTLINLTLSGYLMESVAATVSAAGTNLATATGLTAQINDVTTVGASTGVSLPAAAAGLVITVYSNGANNLKVYPPTSGGTIDGGGAGTAVTLTSTKRCIYTCIAAASGGTWLSAQLGVVSA